MGQQITKVDPIIYNAANGSSYDMRKLALIQYWGYESVTGLFDGDVDRLMETSGATGDYWDNRMVGEFYRYELQDDRAQMFFENAAAKALEGAVQGDADAQYQLSVMYAFGRGMEQSDEKACFWCQAAAANGSERAAKMLRNFWQAGGVLPVDETMAQAGMQQDYAPDESIRELQNAAIEREAAKTRIELEQKRSAPPQEYKITDYSQTKKGKAINSMMDKVERLVYKIGGAYMIAAAIIFVLNFFVGYHETGLFHWVNEGFMLLLGFPYKCFLALISDIPMAEMTTEIMCTNFGFNGGLIISVLKLAFSGVILLVWYGLLYVAWIVVFGLIYQNGIKIAKTGSAVQDNMQLWQERLQKAETVLHQQHLDMLSGTQQLAVLQIAQQRGCNADAAISVFEALQSANKKADPMRYVDLDDRDNRQMVLYYVLRYVLDIPYHAMPKVNFASGSDFAKAYLMYRRGQNYKKAEDELKKILDSQSASKEEKAWAAWVISCICRREHQVPQPMSTNSKIVKAYETKSKTERRRADEMEKRAMAGGCPMVLHDEASLGMLLWSENINALGMMAALFEQKNPQLSAFFADYAKREESLQSDLGNPMNKEKWGRYETGCIVPAYLQLCKEELRIRREGINQRKKAVSDRYWHRTMADERQKVIKDVKKFKGKGFYPFDELMEHMETEIADDISWVDYYDKVEEEQRQARQRAIEREMEAFEEERDDRERMINAVFGQGYFTEQENYLLGRISGGEMIGSALSRDEARDRHRQMVEAAYDESHKNI